MNIWKQVEIKTKFRDISEGIQKCRDINKLTLLGYSFVKKISGSIDSDGNFKLSSLQYGANNYIFCGRFEERNDVIYMIGEIRPRDWFNITLKSTQIRNILFVLLLVGLKYFFIEDQNTTSSMFVVFESVILYLMMGLFSFICGRMGYSSLLKLVKQKVS